ncbi:MAG: AgmX/PglI C-terminal domain-containing protein [Myxococcales bacterium]|nr:AgmX/PglI C-terminal domain-containing protein [Myxococcales bacterium]
MRKEAVLAGVGALVLLGLVWVIITKTRPGEGPRSYAGELESESSGVSMRGRAEGPSPPEGKLSHLALVDAQAASVDKTVIDKKTRDEMRRRILEGLWAERGGPPPGAPLAAPSDGKPLDKEYIQGRVREDFFPMAKQCYEELLARKPDAGGRFVIKFKIVGDAKVGGVVDEAEADPSSTLVDDKMRTCLEQSMLSMAFKPPPEDGTVTVTYPFTFSPGDGAP